jgi:cysteine-rich repeat protein
MRESFLREQNIMKQWMVPVGLWVAFSGGCGEAVCGNKLIEEGESCDDGNTANNDGCKADCSLPACDDGFFDPGELCFAQQSFSTSNGAAKGVGPISIVVGDFNQDLIPDLVTANAQSSDLTALLNDGSGNFGDQLFTTAFFVPFSLLANDFNGDQQPDLIVVSEQSNNFFMFSGGFNPIGLPVDALGRPRAIASLDLPNGVIGFVGLNFDNNVAQLFSVDENLAISPNQPEFFLDTVVGPSAVVTIDLNEDLNQDIVIAHKNQNILQVFLSEGAGTFADAIDIPTTGGATGILADDFDGDGVIDLAITNEDQQSIDIFTRDANQVFQPFAQLSAGSVPAKPVFVDFDGDTIKDLAVSNEGLSVSLLRGNGDGTFQTRLIFNTVDAADFIAIDVNQDGKPDLITLDDLNNLVRILLSTN